MTSRLAPPYMSDPMGWHYDLIPVMARALRPQVYVELGVREANLFNLVAPFAAEAIGVDIDPASGERMESAPNVRFYCCTTDKFLEDAKRRQLAIDMLFIDADHSYEAALQDFKNYLPYVRPHGLILMHDSHPGDESQTVPTQCGGVYRALEELSATNDAYEMVTIPLSPGVTICRKRTRQLSWQEPDGEMRPAHWGVTDPAPTPDAPANFASRDGSEGGLIPERAVAVRNAARAALRPVLASVLGEDRFRRILVRLRGVKAES